MVELLEEEVTGVTVVVDLYVAVFLYFVIPAVGCDEVSEDSVAGVLLDDVFGTVA